MLLAAMLLWVGAVLVGNGVWLIGQARAARRAATRGGSWRRGRPRRGGRRPIELRSGPRRILLLEDVIAF
jgi:hypothetical protein